MSLDDEFHEDAEQARLTADVIAVAPGDDGQRHVLLIERGWPPYAGRLAFPGGHVDPGETTAAAARRELAEETGLIAPVDLALVGVYADPDRDPRGRYATWAYLIELDRMVTPVAGDDAAAARWVPVTEALADLEALAFDHGQILSDAATHLRAHHAGVAHHI